MLTAHNLYKSYGAKQVLKALSLGIAEGNHLALIGSNGAGKSTLIKLLMGLEQPDRGEITQQPGLRIGYLPQEVSPSPESLEVFLQGELYPLQCRLRELEANLTSENLEEFGEAQERFERLGGYTFSQRLPEVLGGVELNHLPLSQPVSQCSGGERVRLALARLLLESPDLLMLDEPTNHLDLPGVEWLETFLASYRGALILVSHDRHFLSRTANAFADLDEGKLIFFQGSYEAYLKERERRFEQAKSDYEVYREEISQLRSAIKGKTFSKKAPGKLKDQNKMAYDYSGEHHQKSEKRIIEQAKQRLEELEENPVQAPRSSTISGLRFAPERLEGDLAVRVKNLSKEFDRPLFSGLNREIIPGERVVITGPNGCGKTTFLRILAGLERPSSGEIILAPGARLAYLEQEGGDLDPHQTVLESYRSIAANSESEARSDLHKYGLFGDYQVFLSVGDLSEGEKRKLQIARLIASRANILLLDEPTNHLDLAMLEEFEQALLSFPGTVLAVSHDRWFIETIATDVWSLGKARFK